MSSEFSPKNPDDQLLPKSASDVERTRLSNFPDIPDKPEDEDMTSGVLLSERIENLSTKYKMIFPLNKEHLKPASYELSVGDYYSSAGVTHTLKRGDTFEIAPFDVVLIQTLETLNLPRFLIARWNIRIKWAYKGLLWVGAPQVDPGFRGFLSCPLYNLSNKPVLLAHGDAIAAMDFVMTTPVSPQSKRYPWQTRTRMVFSDYERDRLESALLTEAARKISEMEKKNLELETDLAVARQSLEQIHHQLGDDVARIQSEVTSKTDDAKQRIETSVSGIQNRIDNYTARTLTVLAVLFAALGLAVSRSPDLTYLSSATPVAAVALWFALRSFYLSASHPPGGSARPRMWFEITVGIILAAFLLTIQYKISRYYREDWATTQKVAIRAEQDVGDMKRDLASQREIQRRLDSLEQRVDNIQSPKPAKK